MPKQDEVFMDLDLDKEYVPPVVDGAAAVDDAAAAKIIDGGNEVKDDTPATTDAGKDVIDDSVPETKEIIVDEPDEIDEIDEPDELGEAKTAEELLADIAEADADVDKSIEEVKLVAEESGDKDLKTKIAELIKNVDEKDNLIKRQESSLQVLGGAHSKMTKDYDLNQVRINELESLMAPVEDSNDLKALIAYSTKGDDGKEKRVEILKKLLAQDGYDVDAIEGERTRQEKIAMAGNSGEGMNTQFELKNDKQEVFSDL